MYMKEHTEVSRNTPYFLSRKKKSTLFYASTYGPTLHTSINHHNYTPFFKNKCSSDEINLETKSANEFYI